MSNCGKSADIALLHACMIDGVTRTDRLTAVEMIPSATPVQNVLTHLGTKVLEYLPNSGKYFFYGSEKVLMQWQISMVQL